MMENNAEQIKKALECCTEQDYCVTCPCDNECLGMVTLIADALALITSQEQRIKRLEKLCKLREQDHNDALDLLYKEEEKNKKLTQALLGRDKL